MITFDSISIRTFSVNIILFKMSKNKKNKIVEAEVSINDLENSFQ